MISMRHIFLPLILSLSLLIQLSLPLLQLKGLQAGFNAAPYLCNLGDRNPTPEAQAHIKDLLKLTGIDVPDDEDPSREHCVSCIMPNVEHISIVLPLPLLQVQYSRKSSFPKTRPEIYDFAQGPPLGSRAPPAFN